jgi:hypothetical protein
VAHSLSSKTRRSSATPSRLRERPPARDRARDPAP